jgi:predicted outer membrane repeat protein
MWVPAGLAEVVNSTFDGNRAAEGGGIAAGHGSLVSVANTLFVRNTTSNASSAALVNVHPADSSLVNHFNGFFGNTASDFANTYGDLDPVQLPSFGNSCCPDPGSPALEAGIPALHFNDADGSRNDIGACGGPALSTYGHLR